MEAYTHPSLMKCPQRDPNRCFQTSDIWQKTQPLLNKPNFNLDVSDIDGAQPKPQRSFSGNRHVNPLNPKYDWSHKSVPVCEVPKFIRCSMDNSDIWGARPSRCVTTSCKQRDSLNFRDIEQSFAGWKLTHDKNVDKQVRNSLDISDINSNQDGISRLRGNRCTNPLQPEYEYDHKRKSGLGNEMKSETKEKTETNSKNIVGHVSGSKSKFFNHFINKPDFVLRTDDITGAKVNMHKWKRKYVRNPNNTSDIDKCEPNTVLRFKTSRCTNPMNPQYTFLDAKKKEKKMQINAKHMKNIENKSIEDKDSDINHARNKNLIIDTQHLYSEEKETETENENEKSSTVNIVSNISHKKAKSGSHDPKYQKNVLTSNALRNFNIGNGNRSDKSTSLSKYERAQSKAQLEDDIASVRSLE